jgi:cation diffusion facilitator family transporter
MMFSTKAGASKLLMGVVIGLISAKAVVSWLTGSISILAQAADSLLDLVAAIVTFIAVRLASKPADTEHPYGHGKWEDVAGVIQSVLLFTAGALVIYSAIQRLQAGEVIALTEAGIAMMAVSIVVSIFLSRHLMRVARATDSVALEANAHNIAGDVYSAIAVLAGLVAIRFTGNGRIDAIIALGVAGYIIQLGARSIRLSASGLLDSRLSADHEAVINACLESHSAQIAGFHKLRTRRSGSQHHIDLHLVLDKDLSLGEAHDICDQIEREIEDRLTESSVTIHAEPCDDRCAECQAACERRHRE